MPTYQYACTVCDHRLEAVQSFTDDPLTVCPQCQGRLRKVFSAVGVVFKGSGFYRTDSRAGGNGAAATAGAAGKDGAGKDTAAKDTAAKDTVGKDGGAKQNGSGTSPSGGTASASPSGGSATTATSPTS